MDELAHTILYVDGTNIIVEPTNYNYLQKKVNLTLQIISEWFQINQLILNTNETFVINFSMAKSLTHTINIIIHNHKLTESIKSLGMHLDST